MVPQNPLVAQPVASILVPRRTFPRGALGMFVPPRLPGHPPTMQVWLSPMPRLVPPGTPLTPPPLQSCRCCVCSHPSPRTWSSQGGKGRGWSLWLPHARLTWRHRLGGRPPPPHFINLRRHHGVGGALKKAKHLAAPFEYRFREGGGIGDWRQWFGGGTGWLRDSWFGTGFCQPLG